MYSKTSFWRSSDRLAAAELLAHAQLLGDRQDDLVVALGLADRLDGLLLDGDALEVRALPGVGDDVLDLERRVGRQDEVGVEAVVLEPRVLGDARTRCSGRACASMVQLPWFQQVMRHGVSVQIMWMAVPPSSLAIGNVYLMNWSSVWRPGRRCP